MKLEDVRELIKLIDESTIEEFEFEQDGAKVLMKKRGEVTHVISSPTVTAPVQVPSVQPVVSQGAVQQAESAQTEKPSEDSNLHKITSPMVGTFYASSSPDAEPFVKAGSKVGKDTVVCIVEAMKLFNEIEADVKGVITEVLVENGQLVEYGQPLFLVKTE